MAWKWPHWASWTYQQVGRSSERTKWQSDWWNSEIRLEIYGYLLLASATFVSDASETTASDRDLALPIRVVTDLLSYNVVALGIAHNHSEAFSWHFYPATLSTCGAIYEEAREVLYGKNVFQFRLPENEYFDLSLLEQCENIFKYNGKEWYDYGPWYLTRFSLASFLNKIGPRNAASLKAIELVTDRYSIDIYEFPLAARLLAYGALGLKSLRVFVNRMGTYQMEPMNLGVSGFDYSVTKLSRAKQEEQLQGLCRILTKMVRGCPLLEDFSYGGDAFNIVSNLKAKPEYLEEILQLLKARKEKKVPRRETTQD